MSGKANGEGMPETRHDMAQETCQYCGDALVIETEDGFICIGCGKETDDEDDG